MIVALQFANQDGQNVPKLFSKPKEIIAAYSIEEVIPCFKRVEQRTEEGNYAAGYVSYEAAPAFDKAFQVQGSKVQLPLLMFGIFDTPEEVVLEGHEEYHLTDWKPSVSRQHYNENIAGIRDAIKQGDTYQVNYTIRMRANFKGDDKAFFTQLSRAQSSGYSAYLDLGDFSILSASPELFFYKSGSHIKTKPMKGTVERGLTLEEDQKKAAWLADSEKNRAENVMIVDLLRNDLGRISVPGSVRVPRLFDIEQYPTVHQMTSTVTAELERETKLVDIFRALFPCGSITGAPKISTMRLINELEDSPREVYCGAIGYLSPDSEAVFNVPIRTVVLNKKDGMAEYGVGGGITWDSTDTEEYEEVLAKTKVLTKKERAFDLLETMLLKDGTYHFYDRHMIRLKKAADYFGYPLNESAISQQLKELEESHSSGQYKIRLLVNKTGIPTVTVQEINPLMEPVEVTLADEPINRKSPFLYHKTTERTIYTHFQKKFSEAFDVLLWNEKEEITEFTNGNVVLQINGQLYTPPVESGLLAGTFREELLDQGVIYEKVLTLQHLKICDRIWFINSVRGWMEVNLINEL